MTIVQLSKLLAASADQHQRDGRPDTARALRAFVRLLETSGQTSVAELVKRLGAR